MSSSFQSRGSQELLETARGERRYGRVAKVADFVCYLSGNFVPGGSVSSGTVGQVGRDYGDEERWTAHPETGSHRLLLRVVRDERH